jgi:hypothetical protein
MLPLTFTFPEILGISPKIAASKDDFLFISNAINGIRYPEPTGPTTATNFP